LGAESSFFLVLKKDKLKQQAENPVKRKGAIWRKQLETAIEALTVKKVRKSSQKRLRI